MKKLLYLMMLIAILVVGTACSHKYDERTNNCNGYATSMFSVSGEGNYKSDICNVLYSDGSYYVCTLLSDKTTEQTVASKIYRVSEDGELKDEISFDTMLIPECVIDGKLAFISTTNEVVLLDSSSGEATAAYPINSVCTTEGVVSIDDGYLVLLDGEAIKYSEDGKEIGKISDNKLRNYDYYYPAFERDGVICTVSYKDDGYMYYKLDFENNEVVELISSNQLDFTYDECFGGYILTNNGEYSINFNNLTITQLADWNNINIIPPRKSSYSFYHPIDDNHFVRIYDYTDGSADVVLFNYDNRIDYSGATPIIVGGYDIYNDDILAWAVYEFNSTHEDYRIILEDYTELFSSGNTAASIYQNNLDLIQYFNQGNAPDIFYGNAFDYRQFGEYGYVQDLCTYIETDSDYNLDSYYSSVKELVVADGKCYSIFPAFFLNGYWGSGEDFGDDVEVSYTQLEEIKPGTSIFGNTYSYNIANEIIVYSLKDFPKFTNEQIVDIVEFSVRNGIASNAPVDMVELPYITKVANGEYLLSIMGNISIYQFARMENETGANIRYIGFPSVYGSSHIANPIGQIAMSSGTNYSDICWEFMRIMLYSSIQDYVTSNGLIPVTDSAMNNLFTYSINPELVPEENDTLKGYFGTNKALSEDVINDYKMAIDSIDTVSMIDWGVFSIVLEEISSYDTQNKSVENIADAIKSRIDIFISENYTW